MALNLANLRNNELFEDALEYVCEHTEIFNTDIASMNETELANTWLQLMAEHTIYHPNYDLESEEDYKEIVNELKSCFALDLICFALTNHNTEHHEVLTNIIYTAHPFTIAMEAAKESAYHSFKQQMPDDINEQFLEAFKSLSIPFNDDRFTAQFLYTTDNDSGYAFEEFTEGTRPDSPTSLSLKCRQLNYIFFVISNQRAPIAS